MVGNITTDKLFECQQKKELISFSAPPDSTKYFREDAKHGAKREMRRRKLSHAGIYIYTRCVNGVLLNLQVVQIAFGRSNSTFSEIYTFKVSNWAHSN